MRSSRPENGPKRHRGKIYVHKVSETLHLT